MSHGPRPTVARIEYFFFLDGKVERDEQSERGRDGGAWHRSVGGGCGRKERMNEVDCRPKRSHIHLLLFTNHPFRAFRSTSPYCSSANSRPTFTSWRHCNTQAVARAQHLSIDLHSSAGAPRPNPPHISFRLILYACM